MIFEENADIHLAGIVKISLYENGILKRTSVYKNKIQQNARKMILGAILGDSDNSIQAMSIGDGVPSPGDDINRSSLVNEVDVVMLPKLIIVKKDINTNQSTIDFPPAAAPFSGSPMFSLEAVFNSAPAQIKEAGLFGKRSLIMAPGVNSMFSYLKLPSPITISQNVTPKVLWAIMRSA